MWWLSSVLLFSAVASPEGEIGYRVVLIPEGSVAARVGLRAGDILADPGALPALLRGAGPEGVEIPLFRLEAGVYKKTKLPVRFTGEEPRRLGTTGDFGYLIARLTEDWERAGLKVHDFVPKIGETFVHDAADMKLVSDPAQKRIEVIRWTGQEFGKLVLRP